jgi:hypothetical protein
MCVIFYAKINDKIILAKNRDRVFRPDVQIVHTLVNGNEICYIQDITTGWVEGINENGCGIVNSTLNLKDGNIPVKKKKNYVSLKSNKIFDALCDNKKKYIRKLLRNESNVNFFEGNTLLANDNKVYHIEHNLKNKYIVSDAKNNSVYTNHGINMPNEGYTEGIKGLSSHLRKKIIEKELEEFEKKEKKKCDNAFYDKISDILNKDYVNLDPLFHPYRDRKLTLKRSKYIEDKQMMVGTTGQLILNITDLELVYYSDVNNSRKVKYINKLPKDYIPKIRVVLRYTKKNTKTRKRIAKSHFSKTFKKFKMNDK